MKKVSVLALVLALAISLTGCVGAAETKVASAYNKMQDIETMESEVNMSFKLEGEGLTEEHQAMLDQVATMLNSSKMNFKTKQEIEDKTMAKAEVKMNMDLGGMVTDTTLWMDIDLSDDSMKMNQIYKLPPVMMNALSQDASKEYLVYNFEDMMNSEEVEEINTKEIMRLSKDLEPKLMELIKDIQENFNPDMKLIESKGLRAVNKQGLNIYEIKLNDETLKELIKYSVNYGLDNKATLEFIKEYMNIVVTAMPEIDKAEAEVEIKEGLVDFEKNLPEFKAKFNQFMEKYKDVTILGEEGIVIELGINKEGYIVHEAGKFNFEVDLAQMAKTFGQTDSDVEGIVKFTINFDAKINNINDKNIKVELPKVDETNSIDYMELLELEMKALESDK